MTPAVSNIRSTDIAHPGVGPAMGALRKETDDFDRFAVSFLDELEAMRSELLQREQSLLDQQNRADEREDRLDAASAEIDVSRQEFERQQQELADASSDKSAGLGKQLMALKVERDVVASQFAAAKDELSQLRGVAIDLAEARGDLAEARAEMLRLHDLADSASVSASASESPSDAEIQRLYEENNELESELEEVRQNASELRDRVTTLCDEAFRQQADDAVEIEKLRKLVDLHSQTTGLLSQEQAPLSSPVRSANESTDSPEKSVVGSVMAQFAKLQRDAAQRRAEASGEKSSHWRTK